MQVDGARLPRWVAGFSSRHGPVEVGATPQGLRLAAVDGELADVRLPFLPWAPCAEPPALIGQACDHLAAPRRIAVLLVRRGGYACARVDDGLVVASKVGSRYVQGKTAAGGWSQQRFARRRANQAADLVDAAAEVATRILLVAPAAGWLVTGGDRPLVEQALTDPRLGALAALPRSAPLAVGDPKRALVDALPVLLRRVSITLSEGSGR